MKLAAVKVRVTFARWLEAILYRCFDTHDSNASVRMKQKVGGNLLLGRVWELAPQLCLIEPEILTHGDSETRKGYVHA